MAPTRLAVPSIAGPPASRTIVIGNGTWIGANVTVIAGAVIGSGCVVAARAVVVTDVPDDTLAAGCQPES